MVLFYLLFLHPPLGELARAFPNPSASKSRHARHFPSPRKDQKKECTSIFWIPYNPIIFHLDLHNSISFTHLFTYLFIRFVSTEISDHNKGSSNFRVASQTFLANSMLKSSTAAAFNTRATGFSDITITEVEQRHLSGPWEKHKNPLAKLVFEVFDFCKLYMNHFSFAIKTKVFHTSPSAQLLNLSTRVEFEAAPARATRACAVPTGQPLIKSKTFPLLFLMQTRRMKMI